MDDAPQRPSATAPSSWIAAGAATFLVFFAATFLKEQADVVSLEATEKAHSIEDDSSFKALQAQIDRREAAMTAQQLRQDSEIDKLKADHDRLIHDMNKSEVKAAEANGANFSGVVELRNRLDTMNARLEALIVKIDNIIRPNGPH